MSFYIYDGSFAGLVCALKEAAGDPAAEITAEPPRQENLFSPAVEIATDLPLSNYFLRQLDTEAGPETSEKMKLFWLWNGPDKEKTLLAYARMAFSQGAKLHDLLADPVAGRVAKAAAAVLREGHRMKGLLRFAELPDRTLYARMEPDHDVLPLLAGHFRRRLPAANWVIHDARRGRAALCYAGKLRLAGLDEMERPPVSDEEKRSAALWRTFFNSIAIRERANPKLQRAGVPLKYRDNMPEFEELPPQREAGRA